MTSQISSIWGKKSSHQMIIPPEQQQSESVACAAVLRKFEHERGQIVAAELHEIDALRVSGKVGLMKPPTAA